MDHDLAAVERLARRVGVHHVALDEVQVLVSFEMRELQRVAVEVVVDDHFVRLDQTLDEMAADETGAAGDADAFASRAMILRCCRSVLSCPRS